MDLRQEVYHLSFKNEWLSLGCQVGLLLSLYQQLSNVTDFATRLWFWNVMKGLVTQSCPALCDPTDCSPLGSSVHGILQAGILDWVAFPFSMGSSWPRGSNLGLLYCRKILYYWATSEALWNIKVCVILSLIFQKYQILPYWIFHCAPCNKEYVNPLSISTLVTAVFELNELWVVLGCFPHGIRSGAGGPICSVMKETIAVKKAGSDLRLCEGQVSDVLLIGCMTLSKLFEPSEPQFYHLWNEANHGNLLVG